MENCSELLCLKLPTYRLFLKSFFYMALPQLTPGDTVSHFILHGDSYPLKGLKEKRRGWPLLFSF